MLLLLACTSAVSLSGDTGSADDADVEAVPGVEDSAGGDTAEPPDDDALYEALFDPAVIQSVDIELSDESVRRLNREWNDDYVEGAVTVNGTYFGLVGVRLKGSSTYMDLDCEDGYCKAAFKIKFNEFVPGQQYGSLERLTLNNMATDYTQSKEVVLYDLLHRQNQIAPRASYARVTLNGEDWGLYANVEAMDDEWLQRRFADTTGNLWGTSSAYADFSDSGLRYGWDLKSGAGDTTQIEALRDALDGYQGDFFGQIAPYVNVEQWLDYWAWCVAIGNYDGYPFHLNDVHIYEDPADTRRFVFSPWGVDESWDLYEYTGQTWNVVYGRLAVACLADVACVEELKVRIGGAADAYDAADVLAMAEAAWALSEADVQTDPVRPYPPRDVFYYRDFYAGVIPTYGDYVREKVGL